MARPLVVARGVHVAWPYWFDKWAFGLGGLHQRVSFNELFAAHHWAIVDFLTGCAYLSCIYAVLLFAVFIAFVDRTHAGTQRRRALGWTFSGVNMAATITHPLYPVAPPWYVTKFGFGPVDVGTAADPAALVRWDAMVGVPDFHHFYAHASDVFGSMPSMHCAYPALLLLYGLELRRPRLSAGLAAFALLDALLGRLPAAPLHLGYRRWSAVLAARLPRRAIHKRPRRGGCFVTAGPRLLAAQTGASSGAARGAGGRGRGVGSPCEVAGGERLCDAVAGRLALGGGARSRTSSPRSRAWSRSSRRRRCLGRVWCQRCISGPLMTFWSRPVRTSMFAWMYIPHTASIVPLMTRPRRRAEQHDRRELDGLVDQDLDAWERDPASQSTSFTEWCASCIRQRSGELVLQAGGRCRCRDRA